MVDHCQYNVDQFTIYNAQSSQGPGSEKEVRRDLHRKCLIFLMNGSFV